MIRNDMIYFIPWAVRPPSQDSENPKKIGEGSTFRKGPIQ